MKLWLRNWWEVQSGRINAKSLRERVFVFLTVIACCLALADALWLSPAQVAHKQLTLRFEKQSAQLQRARDELKMVTRPTDAGKAVRAEVAAVKAQLESVNQTIDAVLPGAAQATPLAQALIHLLRRHAGLTLVRTSTMASNASAARIAQATGVGIVSPVGVLPPALTRQGMELTVSGSYHDLAQYVQALENEMPQVRWGIMKLKGDKFPTELTLQLFLLGVQP